jgi:hypothetical protein
MLEIIGWLTLVMGNMMFSFYWAGIACDGLGKYNEWGTKNTYRDRVVILIFLALACFFWYELSLYNPFSK